ncbi:ABC-F family ATP-binding cassette domain-containing protein [Kurthia zopfii]|uniref:ABC-F family ATP-binding cassette domain-containing protein n=1 Tax=Kurthia zopfii TaxID=1650 RepID=UPI000F6F236E|nr:ABC-F family ATP-binding cassette domain-containing protein [Kurthia zopfii]VEI07139.1 Uncharacterized ABC transporter ATP-binding protein HI_1252 [Kurthia zopfii]
MLLQAKDVSKSYGTNKILSNIDLKIEEGERIGLVGVNGAGKSTLLKIIAGEIQHTEGELYINRGTKIGYLRQNSGLVLTNTIEEEMRTAFEEHMIVEKQLRELELQMGDEAVLADPELFEKVLNRYTEKSEWFAQHDGYNIDVKIDSILQGMGFGDTSRDTVIEKMSGGQKTRLALAKILLQQPNLLILDEPTNHLDFTTLTWLENYLQSYPGAILVVSHDRYFLDALVKVVYEIERTRAIRYTGNYSKFVELKAENRELQMKKYIAQQTLIAEMEDYVRRNIARATSSKSAKNKQHQLEKLVLIEKPDEDLARSNMAFTAIRGSHKEVLKVRDLAVKIKVEDEEKTLLQQIKFDVFRGDKIALIGANGIGKSTLVKTLLGEYEKAAGEITWGKQVEIGYYDQEQQKMDHTKTILDEVWGHFPKVEEAKVRAVLGNFLFTGDDVFKIIGSLSGGEKARVALSKLMLKGANVLVMDEPTNHLDLYSKDILEDAIANFEGTLIFISHDRYFLNKLSKQVLELTPTGANMHIGNFEDYLHRTK